MNVPCRLPLYTICLGMLTSLFSYLCVTNHPSAPGLNHLDCQLPISRTASCLTCRYGNNYNDELDTHSVTTLPDCSWLRRTSLNYKMGRFLYLPIFRNISSKKHKFTYHTILLKYFQYIFNKYYKKCFIIEGNLWRI